LAIWITGEYDRRNADLGTVHLHYVRVGAGEPVMFTHGWPGF